ncbi:Uncharacterised protein [uncultured archaeon]|nr:Uncharacterised protein [uncultured archaeon]
MFESHCTICLERITDPVCIRCYIKQFAIWFEDTNLNPLFLEFTLEKIKDKLLVDTINDTDCIICKKENVNICFYCFGFITVEILKELNISEELIDNFSESFNYDLMERELEEYEEVSEDLEELEEYDIHVFLDEDKNRSLADEFEMG